MPAARYWRAVGLQPYGGGALEMSAFHMYHDGVRVDVAAALTSLLDPSAGTVSALQDSDTMTTCRWSHVRAPGFALVWDFGTAQEVTAVRLGAGASAAEFLERVTIQQSSDGIDWATFGSATGLAFPGASAMQDMPPSGGAGLGAVIGVQVIRSSAVAQHAMAGEDVVGSTQSVTGTPPSVVDIYDAGRGRIIGTVKEKHTPANAPLKRRVVLLSMPGSRAVRETWSDPVTGAYAFNDIAADRTYTVISYDHTGIYRGVVADNLTPESTT